MDDEILGYSEQSANIENDFICASLGDDAAQYYYPPLDINEQNDCIESDPEPEKEVSVIEFIDSFIEFIDSVIEDDFPF